MTDTPRRRSRARNAFSVYATTAALFVTVGGFLGIRMANGHDPALGSQTAQVVSATGSQSGRASTSGSGPLQTRTSGAPAASGPGGQGAATHSVSTAKKKLQTRTSAHGGHHGDGSEGHDA